MKSSEKSKTIRSKLEQIEQEMKNIGYWDENPPQFSVSNYIEAPSFELWLQCVFIPNAYDAFKRDKYPSNSQVGLMALRQYDYHSHHPEAQKLLHLLNEFDEIIKNNS
ncbi:MAG: YqcC family protein [Bacteroidetes bacterium]|nr:YqcC family protein [Bacteroidota bacterium]